MSHVKVKMHQILFPASVCSFVRVKLHLRNGRTDGRRTDGQYVDVTRALCINVKSYTMLQRSLHNVHAIPFTH